MRGIEYNWNEVINKYSPDHLLDVDCIGFIAQELELIFPEFVGKWKMNDEFPDARTVDYSKVVAVLVEAIKEQQFQIKDNSDQIEELKSRINALEK